MAICPPAARTRVAGYQRDCRHSAGQGVLGRSAGRLPSAPTPGLADAMRVCHGNPLHVVGPGMNQPGFLARAGCALCDLGGLAAAGLAALAEAGIAVDRAAEIRREPERGRTSAAGAGGGMLALRLLGRGRFNRALLADRERRSSGSIRSDRAVAGLAVRVTGDAAISERELLLVDQVLDLERTAQCSIAMLGRTVRAGVRAALADHVRNDRDRGRAALRRCRLDRLLVAAR